MPAKRAGDDAQVVGGARKRVASASTARTGQACNRCKLRKIKCDARPGGCSPCLQNNTECTTTDRITGRAVSRGHTETVESENVALRVYTEELQQQLRDNGIEPKQAPEVPSEHVHPIPVWPTDAEQQGSWGHLSSGGGVVSPTGERGGRMSQPAVLPDFRPGCIGDNYLGVLINDDWLSPIAGTRLSLFGISLDLAEFIPADSESASDPTSYETFLNTSLRKNGAVPRPPLPPLELCTQYANLYFKMIQTFTPILHRPDFMKLLPRVHSGQHEPDIPETVMIHMVIAIVMFQAALRNASQAELKHQSLAHYHYAISFIPDLLIGHQLVHVQALTLICLQLRQQPRTGAAWTFSQTVLTLAIQLGLHRSATSWQSTNSERDPHTVELRKRIFWSLLVINVNVGGKLGRPMPLRTQDFDIEMPDPVGDSLPGETNLTKWQKCSFRAALPGMKLLKILMQVYATVYSVRTDSTPYELSVRRLEKELEIFREQLPPEISGGPQTSEEDQCPALYLQMAEEEIRLILHHPSVRVGSPDPSAKNLDICLDASKNLLVIASQLQAMKALDTTWYYSTDYLAAIFTTLFVWTQRRDRMTSADFQQLKVDMDKWLDVMGDVGILLGSGHRLRECLRNIIEPRIADISHQLATKTASAGLASTETPISPPDGYRAIQPSLQQQPPPPLPPPPPPQQVYTPANGYSNNYHERPQSADMPHSAPREYAVAVQHHHHHHHHQIQPQHEHQHPHPQQQQQQQQQSSYPHPGYYSEPTSATVPQYPSMNSFDSPAYPSDEATRLPMSQTVPPPQHQHPAPPPPQEHHQQPPLPTYINAYPAQPNGYHPPPPHQQQPPLPPQHQQIIYPGQAAWRGFADDMMTNFNGGGGDYMAASSALMSLGGATGDNKPQMGMEQVVLDGWPVLNYDGGGGGGGQG